MSRVPDSDRDGVLPFARKFVRRHLGHLISHKYRAEDVECFSEELAEHLAQAAHEWVDEQGAYIRRAREAA